MTSKQLIVAIIRRNWEQAMEAHRTRTVEHAAAIASANAWDQYHPDDGIAGRSQNPYDVGRASENEMSARTYLAQIKAAYDLTVDTFLKETT
jgi:hypothetical protein